MKGNENFQKQMFDYLFTKSECKGNAKISKNNRSDYMTHPRVVLDNHENAYPSLRSSSRSSIADQCNTSFQNMFNLYL